jgi:basic membrane lipoprotein Med (substrate-binding protein (PBP1-ABC) superfamily)
MKRKIIWFLLLPWLCYGCENDDNEFFSPDFEVFVLLPAEGLGDRSFVDNIYAAIEEVKLNTNIKVNYIIPESLEKGEAWVNQMHLLKSDIRPDCLIIIAGSQYTTAIDALNGQFGSHSVLFFEGTAREQPNLAQIGNHTYAPSYIAGYLSALKSDTCKAIVLAGFDAPFLAEYIDGFHEGIIDAGGSYSPPAFVSTGFSGFEMPDSAYQIALGLLESHQLIFALATGSNQGIINAAREYVSQRYVVGVDADQSWMGYNVVTGSIIKLYLPDVEHYIEQFRKGSFKSGNFTKTQAEGRTSFLLNPLVMKTTAIPESLLQTAIQKEAIYLINKGTALVP